MSRAPSFAFIPEDQLVDNHRLKTLDRHTVTISRKYGTITFSMDYVTDHSLNGKFIKFMADPSKNVIGWKILKENNLPSLNGYRQVRVNESIVKNTISKTCKLGVGRLLDALKIKDDASTMRNLKIKTYKAQGFLDEDIDYVELS